MELLEEVREFIKKREKRSSKEKGYIPRKLTIERIENGDFEEIAMTIRDVFFDILRNGYGGPTYFKKLTKIEHSKIKEMTLETKQIVKNALFKGIDNITIDDNDFYWFVDYGVERQKERIRYITRGQSVEDIIWVSKEEEKTLLSYYKEITKQYFAKMLELEEKKYHITILENILKINDCSFGEVFDLNFFIKESSLKDFYEKDDISDLKEVIHRWYNETNQNFVKYRKTYLIHYLNEVIYVFKDEKRKDIKKNLLQKLERNFQDVKNGETKMTLSDAKMMEEQLLILEKW